MTSLRDRLSDLPALVADLMAAVPNPGISIGVMLGDEIEVWTHGMANIEAGLEVTPDTVFQIGSNTKLLTASTAMALVDEGLLELDAPVVTYAPELTLGGADASTVTIRHLLTHTGGFFGDFFGIGQDDTIADYVGMLSEVHQLHPVGRGWSYCNSGFVVLGHVIERVTGMSYDDALRSRILEPLGDTRTSADLSRLIAERVAQGYSPNAETGELERQRFDLWPSIRPAGAIMSSTAESMLAFIRMHLDEGRAADGTQVLSAQSVAQMQQHQTDVPMGLLSTCGWGLGWALAQLRDGQRVIGHGGSTPSGHVSALEVVPELRLAVVSLSNSPLGAPINSKVLDHVFSELAGSAYSLLPADPKDAIELDVSGYLGEYVSGDIRIEVTAGAPEDGGIVLTVQPPPDVEGGALSAKQVLPAFPVTPEVFATPLPDNQQRFSFSDFDADGRPQTFFLGRLYPRAS